MWNVFIDMGLRIECLKDDNIKGMKQMHHSIWPFTIPPPGNPRVKSSLSGLGVENCLKQTCLVGRGVGQIKNTIFSLILQSGCRLQDYVFRETLF